MAIAAEEPSNDSSNSRGGGNRLVVTCNTDDWKRLCQFIDIIDRPQTQVAFEVIIIDLDDQQDKELGAQIQTKSNLGAGINSLYFNNLSTREDSSKDSSRPTDGKTMQPEGQSMSNFIDIASTHFLE